MLKVLFLEHSFKMKKNLFVKKYYWGIFFWESKCKYRLTS